MTIRVNGRPIPDEAIQYELDRLVRFYSEHMSAEQIREQMDALKQKAKEQALGARLLIEESLRLDLVVPEKEVDTHLQAMIQQAGGREQFEALVQRQGLTVDTVKKSIEQGRRVDMLVDRITEGLADPTEVEMQAHFKDHEEEYCRPDRAQVRHILVKAESGDEAARGAARSKIGEIRKRIEEGADFAEEAAAHSECPSGTKSGGSLGWITPGMTLPELDNAVFSLEVGQLSEIVETPLGFHLLEKTASEEGGPAEYDDVRDKVRDLLRHVKRGEAIATAVEELKQKAVIEDDEA